MNARLTTLALTGAAVLALSIGGCSASVGGDGATSGDMIGTEDAGRQAYPQTEMAAVDSLAYAGDMGATIAPSVIVSGNATVITADPTGAAAEFSDAIVKAGGRIDSSSRSQIEASPYASVSARIPADSLDEVIASLDQYGRVQNVSTFTEDVGQQLTDLNARIDVLRESIERLQELMDKATSVDELIAAENGMTQRQAELDSLQAQKDWIDDQVQMSSLYVDFMTQEDSGTGFSLATAWQYFLNSLKVVAYGVLIALPWAALLGLIYVVIRQAVRRRRESHRTEATVERPVHESEAGPSHDTTA